MAMTGGGYRPNTYINERANSLLSLPNSHLPALTPNRRVSRKQRPTHAVLCAQRQTAMVIWCGMITYEIGRMICMLCHGKLCYAMLCYALFGEE